MTTMIQYVTYAIAAVAGIIVFALIILNILLLIWMCKRNRNPFANAKYKLVPPRSPKRQAANMETPLKRQGSYVNNETKGSRQKRGSKKRKNNDDGDEKESYEIVEKRKNIGASLRTYSDTSFDKLRRNNYVSGAQDGGNDYGTVRAVVETEQYDTTFSLKKGLNNPNPDEPYDSISCVNDNQLNLYETTFGLNEKSTSAPCSPRSKPLPDLPSVNSAKDCKDNIQGDDVEIKKSSNERDTEEKAEENVRVSLVSKKNVNYTNVLSENTSNIQSGIPESKENVQCSKTSSYDSSLTREEKAMSFEVETCSINDSEHPDSCTTQEENLDHEVFIENINGNSEVETNIAESKVTKEIQTENSYLLEKIREKERRERQSACTQVDDDDFED